MPKETKIRLIKRILKVTIASCVLLLLVILGFFVNHTYTFENSNMQKWLTLSNEQQIQTVKRIVPNLEDNTLLIQCVSKIAGLPDSEKMDIRDAVALCYNGIKINTIDEE